MLELREHREERAASQYKGGVDGRGIVDAVVEKGRVSTLISNSVIHQVLRVQWA